MLSPFNPLHISFIFKCSAIDFKRKFAGILNERSTSSRVFYCHFTTVIVSTEPTALAWQNVQSFFLKKDTKSTKYILTNRMCRLSKLFVVPDKLLQ